MGQTEVQRKHREEAERAFAGEVMGQLQCDLCKHLKPPRSCAAFPRGIPVAVMTGKIDHSKPIEGDNGVHFEAVTSLIPGFIPRPSITAQNWYGLGLFSPVCGLCQHFNPAADLPSCAAFDIIPEDIYLGRNPHTSEYKGDRGIRFTERARKPSPST